MRHLIKSLGLGLSGLLTVLMLAMSFAPPTPNESQALGPDHERLERVQMRLANVIMTVAPDFAVTQLAKATDLPESIVRQQLIAKAGGQSLGAMSPQETAAVDPTRRIEAGGALFVQAN